MEVRKYFTLGEEIFNTILHGSGAVLAIIGLIFGVIKAEGTTEVLSVVLFTTSAILLYLMSTLYHGFPIGTTKNIFERFDHSAIYLLIAGTYSPFCLLVFKDTTGLILFISLWVLAAIGITFKSIWIDKFVVIHVFIYLLMGWAIIFKISELFTALGTGGIVLLVAGGISYSVGTIFYVFNLFKFHHAVWHIFVLIGTITHYLTVYIYVL